MSLCRVPGKIVLFGEWAVLEGAPGIAIAVDNFCESQCEILSGPPRLSWKTPLQTLQDFSGGETSNFLQELAMHPLLTKAQYQAASVETRFDWNLNYGLGSSSALVITALKFFSELKTADATDQIRFWRSGRRIQQDLQSGKSSGLDLAAQIFGGAIVVEADQPKSFELSLPSEILFFHSGVKFSTKAALEKGVPMDFCEKLGRSSEAFLLNRDWRQSIDEHYHAFLAVGLVDAKTQEFKKALQKAGIDHSLKSCGAGGSETLMLWASAENRSAVTKISTQLGLQAADYSVQQGGLS